MKVFFIQDTLINAGTEKSLLQILPLVSPEIEFKVVYFYPRHDLKDAYERAGIPLVFLDLEGKYDFWNGIQKLKDLIKNENPDLLVSSLLRSNLIARMVALWTGVPLIGTFVNDSYNSYQLEIKKGIQRQKFIFFWGLDRITSWIPKFYISNSIFIAHSHFKPLGIPKSKTKVIYRGRSIPNLTWKRGNSEAFNFLSFGRLLVVKGFEELVQAFANVHCIYPNTRLVIYGEGLHRPILENLIKKNDLSEVVDLPGVIPNVTEMLYKADCFVFPSWYEGFSGALVEAMMSGIPIIASDIPMNLEAVTPDVNALTFPVRDVNALTQKMNYAITNQIEMAELGRKAREEACNRFDIQLIAKQYESVLREAYQKYAAT